MPTLAIVGTGAMGTALLRGLLESGAYQAHDIVVYDVRESQSSALAAELGVQCAAASQEAIARASVVILAVKPNDAIAALREMAAAWSEQLLISIVTGLSMKALQQALGREVPCLRVMPNTPCLIGQGANVMAASPLVTAAQLEAARRIFSSVGMVETVAEKQLDAVTGLSGSGPAFVYLFVEALADAGVSMGLARDLALRLAAQTVAGAAAMVRETGEHPAVLKDRVTSPGGTTIAGLKVLEQRALRGAVIEAVQAAALRARELGQD